MVNTVKQDLCIDKKTLVDKVFPARIASQNRAQSTFKNSLLFPVSLILALADEYSRSNKGTVPVFRKKDFLRKVAGKVEVWYLQVANLDINSDNLDANLDYPGSTNFSAYAPQHLKCTIFDKIKEIGTVRVSKMSKKCYLCITLNDGTYGIVYNPPVLTPTLRSIAISQGTYIYKCEPISIAKRSDMQLDHVVTIAAWLAYRQGGKEYTLLQNISNVLKNAGFNKAKITKKEVEVKLSKKKYDDLKKACYTFMVFIEQKFDVAVQTTDFPVTFRLQLIDWRHNQFKIYTENTILAETVKALAGTNHPCNQTNKSNIWKNVLKSDV